MSLKKITSLTMLLSIILMTYTGIMLFISPPGRVAKWSNWEILGLGKDEYAQVHSTFMVLFIVATILHIYYNWKPMLSYMKNKAKVLVVFTKEMLVAFVITLLFLVGTLNEISLFSTFIDFGEDIKNSWEQKYEKAPYPHAELDTLEEFALKIDFDLDKSLQILKSKNIEAKAMETLKDIAKNNNTSAQKIFSILSEKQKINIKKSDSLSGLGRKSISEVAKDLEIDTKELISKLKDLGIDAKSDDKFKSLCESVGKTPKEVIKELGF
ncbi:hypothetical protein CRV01_00135 [Arcobacter sp. CECT 8983]|uniref:DUF4405 domain-containing protein n=1 Tax=Arcobacter sp. CECT 8983 TaxID=2044508 RepID=UPI00100AAB41|nr:DUF4405 domain-containing protein [Arcobacter sp. CECT 8983]RXJ91536.1 hypothetical protein CRV01_00135 [Arcobacter sp. CECT 8983]